VASQKTNQNENNYLSILKNQRINQSSLSFQQQNNQNENDKNKKTTQVFEKQR